MQENNSHKMAEDVAEKVWYFAFGSNMNPKVLSGRRKVYPTQSKPSYVPGWYLNFDVMAIPYLEPAFASIGEKPVFPNQPEVHGVVHEITRKDYEQIRRTEGGGGHENVGYASAQLIVHTYDGSKVTAYTLIEYPTKFCHGQFYPSKRYMNLLEAGSVEFGLKPFYQEWLKSIPRYVPMKTLQHFVGRMLFLGLTICCLWPLLLPMVIRHLTRSRRAPRWTYLVSKWFISTLSHVYYYIFFPIFGPGAGEPNSV